MMTNQEHNHNQEPHVHGPVVHTMSHKHQWYVKVKKLAVMILVHVVAKRNIKSVVVSNHDTKR